MSLDEDRAPLREVEGRLQRCHVLGGAVREGEVLEKDARLEERVGEDRRGVVNGG